jgi:hypothetical protein
MNKLLTTVIAMSLATSAMAQSNFNALGYQQSTAYFSNLMFDVHQKYNERTENFNRALNSKAEMQRYCSDVRARYQNILGEMPVACPLNAKITGRVKQNGFTMEKIVFESTQGRYVTANLYLPDGKGPFPATVEMCGHGLTGKHPWAIEPLMARNGMAVFVVDPIGQGERWQLMDDKGNYATRGVTTEHTLVNASCVVVGTSLAALQCWDNHCAIDYLMTRRDIDHDNIGAFGCSGGGTETAYLIGFDNRIKAATICSYFSSRERTFELLGPSDGCQHISGEGTAEIELEDFPLMMAPKPVLIMSGKYDFVDLWGAINGYHHLQKAYKTLGEERNIDQIVVETGHGMGKEKRNKMVKFFKHWLCHADSSTIVDDESSTLTLDDSYCTPCHQVDLSYADALSIPQANKKLSDEYASARSKFTADDATAIKKKVLELLGISMPTAGIRAELTRTTPCREYTEYRYQLIREGEMPVPVVILYPDNATKNSRIVIELDDAGKNHFLSEYDNYSAFLTQGTIVVAADLRGRGETEDPAYYTDAKYWNREYRLAMTSLHINKPLMGQRVTDLLTLTSFLASDSRLGGHDINIVANGIYGPAAIHAAYLNSGIKDVEISRATKSFTEFCTNPLQHEMFSNVLVGVLKYYDLPDLIKLCHANIHYTD